MRSLKGRERVAPISALLKSQHIRSHTQHCSSCIGLATPLFYSMLAIFFPQVDHRSTYYVRNGRHSGAADRIGTGS